MVDSAATERLVDIGGSGDHPSFSVGISSDGRQVLVAGDGLAGDANANGLNLYVWDAATDHFTLLTDTVAGGDAGGSIGEGLFSPDGKTIAFVTDAQLLASDTQTYPGEDGDPLPIADLYVRNGETGALTLLTHAIAGVPDGTTTHGQLKFTADGSTLFFQSNARLVAGDVDNAADVYGFDVATGSLSLVSQAVSDGPETDVRLAGVSSYSARSNVTADGGIVALETQSHLTAADTDSQLDVYIRDIGAGTTTLLTAAVPGGTEGSSSFLGMSGDGSTILLSSSAQLTADDTDGSQDVFLVDRATGTTTRLGPARAGGVDGPAGFGSIDASGHTVSLNTAAQVTADDTDGFSDAYVIDVGTGAATLISKAVPGGLEGATSAVMSADGETIILNSLAQLTADDTDALLDVYVWQRATGALTLASKGIAGGDTAEANFVEFDDAGTAAWLISHAQGDGLYRYDIATGALDLVTTEFGNLVVSEDGTSAALTNAVNGEPHAVWYATGDGPVLPPPGPILARPGTEDGSPAADQILSGIDGPNSFFFDVDGRSGKDIIANFSVHDVLVTNRALHDGNRDGIIKFGGNDLLDLDGPGHASDTVRLDGIDGSRGLRSLGTSAEDLHVYADSGVRPRGAIEGTVGDDTLKGDAANARADIFFFDTALDLNLGHDIIRNFGPNDVIVTTTELADGNHDGRISFGKNGLLDLPGVGGDPGSPGDGGSIVIKSPAGSAVTSLDFDGHITRGGVDYFVYSAYGTPSDEASLLFA